jgi:hypothetical protein
VTDRERRNSNCGGEKTGEPEEAMKLLRSDGRRESVSKSCVSTRVSRGGIRFSGPGSDGKEAPGAWRRELELEWAGAGPAGGVRGRKDGTGGGSRADGKLLPPGQATSRKEGRHWEDEMR